MAPPTEIALDRNERVLWTGAPPQGLLLRAYDAFLIPFSLVWAAIAIGSFGLAITQHGRQAAASPPGLLYLPMLFFVVVAFYFTIGRFIVDIVSRTHTRYAVTSDRVIIQSGVFNPTLKSLNLRTLTDLTLSERANGSGTITFGAVNPWYPWAAGARWPGMPQTPMFERISNARDVYGILRDAQRASSTAAAS